MGNETAVAVQQRGTASLIRTFADAERYAEVVAKSRLFPGIETPEQALAIMMQCDAQGVPLGLAPSLYHVIKGRLSMRADAMQAEFQRRGGIVRWLARSDSECRAEFSHPSSPEPLTIVWTESRAKKAQLWGQGGWAKFPGQMLAARVISEGVRAILPAVVVGIYTPEEVADFDAQPPRVTPEPVAAKTESVQTDKQTEKLAAKLERPAHTLRLLSAVADAGWTKEQGKELMAALGFASLLAVPADGEGDVIKALSLGYAGWCDAEYLSAHPPTAKETDWLTMFRDGGWSDADALRAMRAIPIEADDYGSRLLALVEAGPR